MVDEYSPAGAASARIASPSATLLQIIVIEYGKTGRLVFVARIDSNMTRCTLLLALGLLLGGCGSVERTCNTCKGRGQAACGSCSGIGATACVTCRGTGVRCCDPCQKQQLRVLCEVCKGQGRTSNCGSCRGKSTLTCNV